MKNLVKILSLALLCMNGQRLFAAATIPQPSSDITKIKEFCTSNAYDNIGANHLVIQEGDPKFRRTVTAGQARRFQVRLASLQLNTKAVGTHTLVDGVIEFDRANSPRRDKFIKDGKEAFTRLSATCNSVTYTHPSHKVCRAPKAVLTDANSIAAAQVEIDKNKSACSYHRLRGQNTTTAQNIHITNDGVAHTLTDDQAWLETMRIDARDLINTEVINPNEPLSPGLHRYIELGKKQFDAFEKASAYTKGQARAKQQRSTLLGAMWYGATNFLVGSKGNLAQVKSLDVHNKLGSLEAVEYQAQQKDTNEFKRPAKDESKTN